MLLEEDIYLKHYGKKGMRWGTTNTIKPSGAKVKKKPATASQIRKKRQRNVDRVLSGARIAAGILFVSALFAGNAPRNSSPTRRGSSLPTPRAGTPSIRRSTLMNEEAQRNGAFQIRRMLQDMGEDVI